MITVILNQFIPYLICAKPTLIKFDFGVFTNFCIKQVKSNLVNTNTEGGQRKCSYQWGVRIKRVEFKDNVTVFFPQGQS